MTNGDRIRNMTNEELTQFINTVICNSRGWCEDCPSMYGDYCYGIKNNIDKRIYNFITEKCDKLNQNILQKNQKIIQNVVANMRLSNIELTEDDIRRMERTLNNESSIEDEINKLLLKYKNII